MLKSSLCRLYQLQTVDANPDNTNKQVTFRICAPFIDCISEINNTSIDTANDLGIMMSMSNLMEYNNSYVKRLGRLWLDCRDDSESFKFKSRFTYNTSDGVTVELAGPLKYLRNFQRTLEMPLINCEISLDLTWSANCGIYNADGATTFEILDTKLYVPVVTLSTQDNAKRLHQLKSGLK